MAVGLRALDGHEQRVLAGAAGVGRQRRDVAVGVADYLQRFEVADELAQFLHMFACFFVRKG